MLFQLKRCAALLIVVTSAYQARCGEAAPNTFETQIAELESALAESLRMRDLVMLDLAVSGLKAAKLDAAHVEISVLRAERDAARDPLGFGQNASAASQECWGLMARARLGQAAALAQLRKFALMPNEPVEALPAWNKAKPDEFWSQKRIADARAVRMDRRAHALLALALMKEPGVAEAVLAGLPNKEDAGSSTRAYAMYAPSPELLALLAAAPEAGLKHMQARFQNEEISFGEQFAELIELLRILVPAQNHAMNVSDQFSVVGQIRKALPADALSRVIAALPHVLKRYQPKQENGYDAWTQVVINLMQMLPEKSATKEVLDAFAAVVEKMPEQTRTAYRQMIEQIYKRQGRYPDEVVKPPVPPKDEPF